MSEAQAYCESMMSWYAAHCCGTHMSRYASAGLVIRWFIV
eukprot:COSAG03_NODE_26704_length_257_cov_0.987342_1_plen_39_part_01